jgi:hypothetical protein
MTKVTAKATYGVDKEPPPGMHNMDPWTVVLQYKKRRMSVPFYMGYGHKRQPPTAPAVLSTLTSDAVTYENVGDAEGLMEEFGYNSRKDANRIFKLIERQTLKLERFLGDDFEDAVWGDREWIAAHT